MLLELREFGEPRSSGWGIRVRLLLSGDGTSEREESEVVVAADAALPGRLEGMTVRGGEGGYWKKVRERGTGGQRRGEAGREIYYKGIDFCHVRSWTCNCHQRSGKLCV